MQAAFPVRSDTIKTMKSTIKALAELILQNVDVFDASIEASGGREPSLDNPYNPEADYPFHNPDVARASDVISAAAMQLIQTVRAPQMCLISESVMVSTAPFLKHFVSKVDVQFSMQFRLRCFRPQS